MAAKQKLNKRTPAEESFWDKACVAAELPVLLTLNKRIRSSKGAAHLMADFADDLLAERRRRFNNR